MFPPTAESVRRTADVIALHLLFALALLSASMGADVADTILIDGKIVTLDSKESIVEAVAIRAGRILAVGRTAEIQALASTQTEIIKLDGRMVLPGFIESHCHSIGVARDSLHGEYAE